MTNGEDLLPGLHRGYLNVPLVHCTLNGEDAGSFTFPILQSNSIKSPDLEYSFFSSLHFSSMLLLYISSSAAVQATGKRQENIVINSYRCTTCNPFLPTEVLHIIKCFQDFTLSLCFLQQERYFHHIWRQKKMMVESPCSAAERPFHSESHTGQGGSRDWGKGTQQAAFNIPVSFLRILLSLVPALL